MAKSQSAKTSVEKAQLVLILPRAVMEMAPQDAATRVQRAVQSGEVAAVLVPRYDLEAHTYKAVSEAVIPTIQAGGSAALLDGMEATQDMGRLNADGHLIEANGNSWVEDTLDLLQRFDGEKMIGLYGAFSRDTALTAGDIQPDVVIFGPLGGDIKPEPHKKNTKIAQWWAEMVEVPCVVPAGNTLESVVETSQTGADFVGLSRAIFEADDAAKAVASACQLIAEHGPELRYETTGG